MPEMFEEWIAHPGRFAYVDVHMHGFYSSRPGWWVSGWRGDADAVRALGVAQTLIIETEDANGKKRHVAAVELIEIDEETE